MNNSFDNALMFDNITLLLRTLGKKIGELENEAGVSPGYISRTSKEPNAKPGIDFIMNVANALNTSVDTLVSVDLSALTPTEHYLISFIEKLKADTILDKLNWERETVKSLKRLEPDYDGDVAHPLFSYETYKRETERAFFEEVDGVVFISNSFECNTTINKDCFNLRMKNGNTLYIMNICKDFYENNTPDAFAIEIWMHSDRNGAQFLCSNKNSVALANVINDLYSTIEEFSKHPKIKEDLKYIIDAYMKNDFEDDPFYDVDLPF